MKKQKILLLIGGAVLLGGLTACNFNSSNEAVTERRMNTLAYQATTSLATVKDLSNNKMMRKAMNIAPETKTKIEELLPSIDLLIENDGNFESEILESDREDYQIKQVVSFKGLLMETSTYTLFYNVVSENENVETDKDDDDDDDKETSSETETEVEIEKKFVGIAVLDDLEIPFTSTMETETEGNEYEEEMKFVLKTGVDSYVSVKQEIEKENNEYEEEYHYSIVENGKLVYEFSLENEMENTDQETEIDLTVDGKRYRFDVYQEKGDTFVEVKVDGTEDKLLYKKVITVNEETNEKIVSFEQVI